jgi:flagellar biosynthesis GTPase FlhF
MDSYYNNRNINISNIQLDNQYNRKLSRYNFIYSYYPKVNSNVYNSIYNYYNNMNYQKKDSEFIISLNEVKYKYNDYMTRNEEHIRYFSNVLTFIVYTYVIIQILIIITDIINMIRNYYDNNREDAGYFSDYIEEDEEEDEDEDEEEDEEEDEYDEYEQEDEEEDENVTEYEKENENVRAYEEEKEEIKVEQYEQEETQEEELTEEEEKIRNIQELLLYSVFGNITMKQLKSRCNKSSLSLVKEIHEVEYLNKSLIIYAFIHTLYQRYINYKNVSCDKNKTFYQYLVETISSYGPGKYSLAAFNLDNTNGLGEEGINDYISYYFDIESN